VVGALPAIKGYGPACPHCGSIRSHCMENGWSEPDDDYLRRKRCNQCGETFVTVEKAIPVGRSSFYRLDYRGRHNRREHYRTRLSKTKRRLPNLTKASDQLHVSIRVTTTPSRVTTCMRGHPWKPETTYVYPETGFRQCKICRKQTQHDYYIRRKAEQPSTISPAKAGRRADAAA
jgi:hypothetical protein